MSAGKDGMGSLLRGWVMMARRDGWMEGGRKEENGFIEVMIAIRPSLHNMDHVLITKHSLPKDTLNCAILQLKVSL